MTGSLHEDAAWAIDRALAARDSIERSMLLEQALELHRRLQRRPDVPGSASPPGRGGSHDARA